MKKIFISYCWGQYDEFVEILATKILDRYEVIFDKWEIKHGNNMDFFMENSIREADKVFVICEKEYVKKANYRTSGVGVETSIISAKVYRSSKQEKFIPVFLEGVDIKPDYMESIFGIEIKTTHTLNDDKFTEFINAIEGKTVLEKPRFDSPKCDEYGNIEIPDKIDNKKLNEKLEEAIFDAEVYEKIKDLINKDLLSKYLVKHQLYNFGKTALKFDVENQKRMMNSIDDTFVEATGYCGWGNYDLFGHISHHVALNSVDGSVKNIAGSILKQCADVRFNLKDLYDDYVMSNL